MCSGRNLPRVRCAPLAALFATLVVALVAAGCGSDGDSATTVPSGSGASGASGAVVVQAGEQQITKAQFDRALQARLTGTSPLSPASSATVVLDPPTYKRCIAGTRKQLRIAGVKSVPSRKTLRANCAAQLQQARTQVVSTLIQQAWIAQQAQDAGVKAPPAAATGTLAAAQKQAGFQQRLKRSGLTLADLRAIITTQVLTAALVQKATSTKVPTDAQAKRFLQDHPELFGKAARRTVDIVVSASASAAQQAKAALKKGKAVQDVIAGLGVDRSVRQGRMTITDGDGQLAPAVQKAVSAARRGDVVGPIQVGDMYYVVAVRSTRPAKVPPFAKVADKVRQLSLSFQAQDAQNALQGQLAKAWGAKTTCAKGYTAPECANAAAGTSTTATTS